MIALALARLALFLLVGLAFGLNLFAPEPRRGLAALALAALSANIAWLALLSAGMFDVPLFDLTAKSLMIVLEMPGFGTAFLIRTAALLALVIFARVRWMSCGLSGAALASLAWTGHAAAAAPPQLLADMAHLLAAGAWAGAILSLWLGLARAEPGIAARAAGFARPGAVIVAVLVGTGLINGLALTANVRLIDLAAAPWAGLILAKLVLFAGTLALAWRHRTKLVPALQAGSPGATPRLRTSMAVEALLLLGILALVAVAGQLDPAAG